MSLFGTKMSKEELRARTEEAKRRLAELNGEADTVVDPLVRQLESSAYTAVRVLGYTIAVSVASVILYTKVFGC